MPTSTAAVSAVTNPASQSCATSVLTPVLDAVSAGAITIGPTTATSIALAQNVSISGSKTLTTGTGLTTISGDALMAAGKVMGHGTHQLIVAAGATAANVTTRTTRYDLATAANNITSSMADGSRVGQRKTLVAASASSGKTVIVTPTTFSDGTNITLTAKFDAVELEWIVGGWRVCSVSGTASVG